MQEMNGGSFGKLVEEIPVEMLLPPDEPAPVEPPAPPKPPDENQHEDATLPAESAGVQEVKDAPPKAGKKQTKKAGAEAAESE